MKRVLLRWKGKRHPERKKQRAMNREKAGSYHIGRNAITGGRYHARCEKKNRKWKTCCEQIRAELKQFENDLGGEGFEPPTYWV